MQNLISNKWRLFLIGILIWHLLWNLIWIIRDQAPLPWDSANHARISIEIIEAFQKGKPWNLLRVSDYYPPFVHTGTAAAIFLFGNPDTTVQMVSTFWFLFSIVALFLFTKTYLKNESIAFWTAALFSFFPIAYGESRFLLLDLPATALMLITMVFLEKAQEFKNRQYTLLAFISVSFLALTKWAGLPFAFAPFAIYTLKMIWHWNEDALKNYSIGLLISGILVSPWYLINIPSLIYNLTLYTTGESVDPIKIWSLTNFTHYFTELLNRQITPIAGLIFIISVGILLFARSFKIGKTELNQYKTRYILFYLGFYYLTFTLISNKDPRYTLPALPLVALVWTMAMAWIYKRFEFLTHIIGSVLVFYFLGYFLILNIRPSQIENFEIPMKLPVLEWIRIIDVSDKLIKAPSKNNWQTEEIVAYLANLESSSVIHTAVDFEYFNPLTLNYIIKKSNFLNQTDSQVSFRLPDIYTLKINFASSDFKNNQQILRYLETGDYVILTEGEFGPPYIRHFKPVEQLRFYLIGDRFSRCRDYVSQLLQPGSWCYLEDGEEIRTDSDVITYSGQMQGMDKKIIGFDRVSCPWGCSFKTDPTAIQNLQVDNSYRPYNLLFLKEFLLPNGEVASVYKINWNPEYQRKQWLNTKPVSNSNIM